MAGRRGRHAAKERGTRLGRVLMVAMAAILLPSLSFVGLRALSAASSDEAEGCSGVYEVRVAAAPETVAPLEKVAGRIARSKVPVGSNCLRVAVTPTRPVDMFNALSGLSGTGDPSGAELSEADLWIPDSWQWVQRTGISGDRILPISPTIAASPLVLATDQAGAQKLGNHTQSWQTLAKSANMTMSDPEKSGVALSSLLAIRRSLDIPVTEGEDIEVTQQRYRRQLGELMLGLVHNKVQDIGGELEYAVDNGFRYAVPTTEQQVLQHNRSGRGRDLVSILPETGTVLLDYPLIALPQEGTRIERVIEAGSAFLRYIDDDAGRKALRAAGFRDIRGLRPPPDTPGPERFPLLHDTTGGDAEEVVRSWSAMSIDAKVLLIVDVSGSMREQLEDGRTRIELARDAAKKAVSYFPASAKIGLWAFSQARDGDLDYERLVEPDALNQNQRQVLLEAIDGLPALANGGTGLFDTFLAGYQVAQGSFENDRQNSLVLLTDGKNEDTFGIDQEQLIDQLSGLEDPSRSVSTILVGLGSGVDMDQLNAMARATDGRAARATTAEDMERIIVDSILRRQCGATGC